MLSEREGALKYFNKNDVSTWGCCVQTGDHNCGSIFEQVIPQPPFYLYSFHKHWVPGRSRTRAPGTAHRSLWWGLLLVHHRSHGETPQLAISRLPAVLPFKAAQALLKPPMKESSSALALHYAAVVGFVLTASLW